MKSLQGTDCILLCSTDIFCPAPVMIGFSLSYIFIFISEN